MKYVTTFSLLLWWFNLIAPYNTHTFESVKDPTLLEYWVECDLKNQINLIYPHLVKMESGGRLKVIGDSHLKDFSVGILQIRMMYLEEVNDTYGTCFKSEDRYKEWESFQMLCLYLNKGVHRFKKKLGRDPNIIELASFHNGGLYNGYKNPLSLAYGKVINYNYENYKREIRGHKKPV